MWVLRDHSSAIIGQLLNHYPWSIHEATSFKSSRYLYYKISLFMSNFAKGNDRKKKTKTFFFKSSLGYLLLILCQLFKFVQSS